MSRIEPLEYETTYLRPELARNSNTARELNLQSRRRTISFGSSIAFTITLSLTLSSLLLVLLQIRRYDFHCFVPFDLIAWQLDGVDIISSCSSRLIWLSFFQHTHKRYWSPPLLSFDTLIMLTLSLSYHLSQHIVPNLSQLACHTFFNVSRDVVRFRSACLF